MLISLIGLTIADTVQNAKGPLLIEIDRSPGSALGLSLCHSKHNGKRCVCVETIQPMSLADR